MPSVMENALGEATRAELAALRRHDQELASTVSSLTSSLRRTEAKNDALMSVYASDLERSLRNEEAAKQAQAEAVANLERERQRILDLNREAEEQAKAQEQVVQTLHNQLQQEKSEKLALNELLSSGVLAGSASADGQPPRPLAIDSAVPDPAAPSGSPAALSMPFGLDPTGEYSASTFPALFSQQSSRLIQDLRDELSRRVDKISELERELAKARVAAAERERKLDQEARKSRGEQEKAHADAIRDLRTGYEARIAELQKELADLQRETELQQTRVQTDLRLAQTDLDAEMDRLVDNYEQELQHLRQEAEEQGDAYATLAKAHAGTQQKCTDLEAELKKLHDDSAAQIAELQQQLGEANAKLLVTSEHADTLQEQFLDLTEERDKLQREIADMRETTGRYDSDKKRLKEQIDELEEQAKRLRGDVSGKQDELAAVKTEQGRLQAENTTLKGVNDSQQQTINELKAKLQEQGARNRQLLKAVVWSATDKPIDPSSVEVPPATGAGGDDSAEFTHGLVVAAAAFPKVRDERDDLKRKLDALNGELGQQTEEIKDLKGKLEKARLEKENADAAAKQAELVAKHAEQDIERQKSMFSDQIKGLQKDLVQARKEAGDHQSEASVLKATLQQAKDENTRRVNELNESLKEGEERLRTAMDESKTRVKEAEDSRAKAERDLATAQTQLRALGRQLALTMSQHKAQLEAEKAEKEKLEEMLTEVRKQMSDMQLASQVDGKPNEDDGRDAALREREEAIARLQRMLEQTRTEFQKAKRELESTRFLKATAEAESVSRIEKMVQEHSILEESYTQRVNELENKIGQLEDKITELEEENVDLTEKLGDRDAELEKANSQLEEKDQEINGLNGQVSRQRGELDKLKQEITGLNNDVAEAKERMNTAQKAFVDSQKELKDTLIQLEDERRKYQTDVVAVRTTNTNLEAKCEKLGSEHDDLDKERQELKQQLTDVRGTLAAEQSARSNLEGQLKQLNEVKEKLQVEIQRNEGLASECTKLHREGEGLRKELAQVQHEKEVIMTYVKKKLEDNTASVLAARKSREDAQNQLALMRARCDVLAQERDEALKANEKLQERVVAQVDDLAKRTDISSGQALHGALSATRQATEIRKQHLERINGLLRTLTGTATRQMSTDSSLPPGAGGEEMRNSLKPEDLRSFPSQSTLFQTYGNPNGLTSTISASRGSALGDSQSLRQSLVETRYQRRDDQDMAILGRGTRSAKPALGTSNI